MPITLQSQQPHLFPDTRYTPKENAVDVDTHPKTTAQHVASRAITAMVQATLPGYAGSSILTDNIEHPETTEDNPTPAKTDAKDQPANTEIADLNDDLEKSISQWQWEETLHIERMAFFIISTFEWCGGLERTDFELFPLLKGVVV